MSVLPPHRREFTPGQPASLPPELPEWDPLWSRLVTVHTFDGERTFHVLDTLPALRTQGLEPTGTIIALHGNPTWSYLWRRLATASLTPTPGSRIWRVIAPDQLEMGYSQRLEHTHLPTPLSTDPSQRRMGGRITDLDAVIHSLIAEVAVTSASSLPLVTLGHDWGGVLSLAWASRNREKVAAVITLNTAVWHDTHDRIPAALRTALTGPVLPFSTVRTDAFIRATLALSSAMAPQIQAAYRSPYLTALTRHGVGQFVADIPATTDHPSYPELTRTANDIRKITAPALILWGPKDPVFQERYLRDLRERLPQADIHRFEGTSHLFVEDIDYAATILSWLDATLPASTPSSTGNPPAPNPSTIEVTLGRHRISPAARLTDPTTVPNVRVPTPRVPSIQAATVTKDVDPPMIFAALDARHTDASVASVDMTTGQAISWAQLSHVVDALALGLKELGLTRGDRVSLLIPPGNNLTAAAYAVLKAGGVAVVADAGLGIRGMTRAIRAADPQWIIGEVPGLTLARTAGWPGRRISVSPLGPVRRRALGVETSVTELSRRWVRRTDTVNTPTYDDDAAILFTSGSTGPAKGVRYTHRALAALAATLKQHFNVTPGTGLVAGFPPFALLGPGIGATSVTPDMAVTKPRTLTASAVAQAVIAGQCTMVFASPAAFTNVTATAHQLTEEEHAACADVQVAMSAGAPVTFDLMRAIRGVFPHASIHSPYGMTEGLLLTDITAQQAAQAYGTSFDGGASATVGTAPTPRDHGVCVGTPVEGVRFALAPIGPDGTASDTLIDITGTTPPDAVGVLSEFVVSAGHIKTGYDRLWSTDQASKRDRASGLTWHRTNDVGHVDAAGRVWMEGRLQHIITTATGPVAPGGIEAVVDAVDGVARSAAVGIGPVGTQVVAIVLERHDHLRPGLADLNLTSRIRSAVAAECGVDVAAVLVAPEFPTDIRHNSKINRDRLRDWANTQLS